MPLIVNPSLQRKAHSCSYLNISSSRQTCLTTPKTSSLHVPLSKEKAKENNSKEHNSVLTGDQLPSQARSQAPPEKLCSFGLVCFLLQSTPLLQIPHVQSPSSLLLIRATYSAKYSSSFLKSRKQFPTPTTFPVSPGTINTSS